MTVSKRNPLVKEYPLLLALFVLPIILYNQHNTDLFIIISINILSLSTILFSAFSVVQHADVLAHRLGEPYGSLILSLSVVILEVSLISALMTTDAPSPTLMRDTLYSIIMIVMSGMAGLALLIGGRKFATQFVNLAGIKQYLTALIPLAIIILILPSTLPGSTFSSSQLPLIALISIVTYTVFLIIQTKTHQSLFIYEDDEDISIEHPHIFSPSSDTWHAVWLVIHLISVIVVTKINATPLEYLLDRLQAPKQFTGFLVALLILSPEGLGALKAALNNHVQRAMNIFFGSVLATISLTVPAVTIIALLTGNPLTFGLDWSNAIIMITILLLCQVSFSTGRTNQLNGIAHLVVFGVYLMILMQS